MRFGLIIVLFALVINKGFAQNKYWILFSDKGENVQTRLMFPEKVLSAEAIAKRKKKGIAFTVDDLPVDSSYVSILEKEKIRILSTSRWLNGIAVEMASDQISYLSQQFDFVKEIIPVSTLVSAEVKDNSDEVVNSPPEERPIRNRRNLNRSKRASHIYDYGNANLQNNIINIAALHSKGYTGRGVRLAIFDAGFMGADTIAVFDSLRAEGRLLAHYDFVDDNKHVFHASSHGTEVLSTIASLIPGEMVGTAPHVSVILCRTENASSESIQEEYNWVEAMEWVDSIGVDIIHSSLGYTEFDNKEDSYEYNDLDGNTAIITRAADKAAAKGIVVTTSAGNEGSLKWHYISAPCDADSVLCIGSVDRYRERSRFSSFGPAADGRVKPDVVALGTQASVASSRNTIHYSQGTSYSSPMVSGLVACLREAHPNRTAMELIQAVILSGDQYTNPDSAYGYGIPDAAFADSLLSTVRDLSTVEIKTFEKPIKGKPEEPISKPLKELPVFTEAPKSNLRIDDNTLIITSNDNILQFSIMKGGRKVFLDPVDISVMVNEVIVNIEYLIPGEHYVHIETSEYEENIRFVK